MSAVPGMGTHLPPAQRSPGLGEQPVPPSSGLGSQFHPEPPADPQWVLGVLGGQGDDIPLVQPLSNELGVTPGMVCRGENPKVPNDFNWGSLGVQSHWPVPAPGCRGAPMGSASARAAAWIGYQGKFHPGRACQALPQLPRAVMESPFLQGLKRSVPVALGDVN